MNHDLADRIREQYMLVSWFRPRGADSSNLVHGRHPVVGQEGDSMKRCWWSHNNRKFSTEPCMDCGAAIGRGGVLCDACFTRLQAQRDLLFPEDKSSLREFMRRKYHE